MEDEEKLDYQAMSRAEQAVRCFLDLPKNLPPTLDKIPKMFETGKPEDEDLVVYNWKPELEWLLTSTVEAYRTGPVEPAVEALRTRVRDTKALLLPYAPRVHEWLLDRFQELLESVDA